ncbi:hypothetical protein TNCV_2832191 [Trichonephila clavipes]|nr:hypothetical protein TNCV_2832191 [Trichonephila clavipes]
MHPHRKKSSGVRSGESGGQSSTPSLPNSSTSLSNSEVPDVVQKLVCGLKAPGVTRTNDRMLIPALSKNK